MAKNPALQSNTDIAAALSETLVRRRLGCKEGGKQAILQETAHQTPSTPCAPLVALVIYECAMVDTVFVLAVFMIIFTVYFVVYVYVVFGYSAARGVETVIWPVSGATLFGK